MQYIQGNPLGRGHSVSLLSFKSNSFKPIRQIWGFCSVALICFCCLARCLFCVDNAEVADLLQDGAFDVCTKILSVALMHWLLVLRIENPYINKRRCRGVGSSDNTDPPQRRRTSVTSGGGNIRRDGLKNIIESCLRIENPYIKQRRIANPPQRNIRRDGWEINNKSIALFVNNQ